MEIQRNHFYIHLLGPIQVEQNNQPIQGFESRKALALLGYLAAQNCPVSREKIVAIFWGEKTEKLGRGNLRRVLHNLNQILPGCLESDRYTLQLKRSPVCQCDIDLFTQFEKQSQLSTQAQAIDIYKGDFMEGIYLDDCPEFEIWLTTEQERWRQRVVSILDTLVQEHSHRGEYQRSLDFAQRLLSLTPWRESVHRQLITLFARTGQRSDALRQYELCRQMMKDEFGAEPAEETTALYRRVRAAGKRPRFKLPTAATLFVGREQELAEISRLLASPDCRLLTLVGLGGMGKTRVALRYAEKHRYTYLDGVAFVPLADLDSSQRLVWAIAQAVGLTLQAQPSPRTQLANYLVEKNILLVLDNFEHILEGATLLSDLLKVSLNLKLLVTSRERLNLRGEWVFPLDGLAVGTPASSADSPSEAVTLFNQRARQADYHFSTDEHVPEICDLLGGIPLGIELAAAMVPHFSPLQIAGQIRAGLEGLTSPLRDIPERHRSLTIVFNHSWQMLSEQERQVFKRLSVFRGGFTREAAERVANANLLTLKRLVGKSLLRRSAEQRYDMHELLRQYASEKLDTFPDEKKATRNTHADYYLECPAKCAGGRRVISGISIQTSTFERIAVDIDNIRTAWEWGVKAQNVTSLAKAVDILGKFHEIRSWYADGKKIFEDAIEDMRHLKIQRDDQPARALVMGILLKWLGVYNYDLGLFEEAQENLQESAVIFRAAEEDEQLGWTLLPFGQLMIKKGNFSATEKYFSEALQLFEAHNNTNGAAVSLEFLGTNASIQGDYQTAQAYYEKSLVSHRQSEDLYGTAGGLYCLGDLARITGDYDRARELCSKSLYIYKTIKSQRGIAQALNQLGHIQSLLGDYEQATQYQKQSLELCNEIGELGGVALSITDLGLNIFRLGDFSKAKAYCQDGLELFRETDDKRGIILALTHLGKTCHALGENIQARKSLLEAVEIAEDIQSKPQILKALVEVARLLADAGNVELALRVVAHPLENPATYQEVREEAQEVLARLEAALSPDTATQILSQEMGKELHVLIEEIEASFGEI